MRNRPTRAVVGAWRLRPDEQPRERNVATQQWTPKRAAAKAQRKLKAAREQLYGIAYLWGDEDRLIDILVDEVLEKLNSIQEAIAERLAEDVSCRYFRPLPTYFGGIKGVRLCWAEQQTWDFACYEGIKG